MKSSLNNVLISPPSLRWHSWPEPWPPSPTRTPATTADMAADTDMAADMAADMATDTRPAPVAASAPVRKWCFRSIWVLFELFGKKIANWNSQVVASSSGSFSSGEEIFISGNFYFQKILDWKNSKIWKIWHRYFRFEHTVLVKIKVVGNDILNNLYLHDTDIRLAPVARRPVVQRRIRGAESTAPKRRRRNGPPPILNVGAGTLD